MKRLLKYLILALFGSLLLGAGSMGDTPQQSLLVEQDSIGVAGEYVQYQHSVYEPQGDIFVQAGNNSSTGSVSRLQAKHKRTGSSGKEHSVYNGYARHYGAMAVYSHSCKFSFHSPYFARTGNRLVSLGKLII